MNDNIVENKLVFYENAQKMSRLLTAKNDGGW